MQIASGKSLSFGFVIGFLSTLLFLTFSWEKPWFEADQKLVAMKEARRVEIKNEKITVSRARTRAPAGAQ